MNKKTNKLEGNKNERMSSSNPTDNEGTAAWANEKSKLKPSDVSMPSLENVIDAKKWVDNGSKL